MSEHQPGPPGDPLDAPVTEPPEPAEVPEAPEAEADDADDDADAVPLLEAEFHDPLVLAERERDDYLDALRRLQAEFENYRKRAQRGAAEAGDRALGAFVEQLLPVLDAVDAARAHGSEEVDQVAALLIDLLARQGLERVDPKGAVFDPTAHEAVAHEAGDPADGLDRLDGLDVQTVAEVFRAGWVWRGKVLRPAMVKVVG